tara:strand:- start:332 stop:505 length:174 start_codon:yes stop_codon:yes gene_type:complete
MQDEYRNSVINVVLSRKLVRETKMFMLKNQLDIPLKSFVEQAIEEKIKKMDEGVDKE